MGGLTDSQTAPQDEGKTGSSQLTPGRFLIEWLLLTALMAAPYLAFGARIGLLAGLGVMFAYISLPLAARRKRPRAPETPRLPDRRYAALLALSGSMLAYALLPAVAVAWEFAAYDLRAFETLDQFRSHRLRILTPYVLSMLLLTAVFYLTPLVLLWRRGARSRSLIWLIRASATGLLRSPLLIRGIGFATAASGLMAIGLSAHGLETLASTLIRSETPAIVDIAGMFPALPLGLLAITALLVLSEGPGQRAALVRTRLESGAGLPLWQGAVAAGGCLVAAIAIMHPIHFATIARLSSVAGIGHWNNTYKAVPDWIADQRDKGLAAAEIAAKLTEHGHWKRGAPEVGLTVLMPELGAKLAELGNACEIAIAAAPADPAAVASSNWMPAKTALSDIKYCIRIACPSPVRWDAPPSALLDSSHPSRNRYWMRSLYIDIFANGAAVTPGGYCTADGGLADDFQG